MKKAYLIYSIFCVGCCYFTFFLVWNSLFVAEYVQLDEKFLSIDPNDYSIEDFPLPKPKYRPCNDASCEYWNFVAEYLLNPTVWMNSENTYHFLGYSTDFHISLPIPPFKTNLKESYYTILDRFRKLRNETILSNIEQTKTLIYLNSDVDFLKAYALQPLAQKYILFSKQSASMVSIFPMTKRGNIVNLSDKAKENLDVLLISIHQYLSDLPKKDLEYNYIDKALPYLLVQLKIIGKIIVDVTEKVEYFYGEEIKCVEINFVDNSSESFIKSLMYCSVQEPIQIDTDSKLFIELKNYTPFVLMTNNDIPGYYEYQYHTVADDNCNILQNHIKSVNAEKIQNLLQYLLKYSKFIIQNEHNIPYYWFSQNIFSNKTWKSKFYGTPAPLSPIKNTNVSFIDFDILNRYDDVLLSPSPIFLDHKERLICNRFPMHHDTIPGFWVTEESLCYDKFCKCEVTVSECMPTPTNFVMVLSDGD